MQRFNPNTYIKRTSGKPVKGILQDKPYKVQFASTRWVKLYGIKNKYSTKFFQPMDSTDILKKHMDEWKPLFQLDLDKKENFPDRLIELCKLAYGYKAGDFLTEAIMKGLIK